MRRILSICTILCWIMPVAANAAPFYQESIQVPSLSGSRISPIVAEYTSSYYYQYGMESSEYLEDGPALYIIGYNHEMKTAGAELSVLENRFYSPINVFLTVFNIQGTGLLSFSGLLDNYQDSSTNNHTITNFGFSLYARNSSQDSYGNYNDYNSVDEFG